MSLPALLLSLPQFQVEDVAEGHDGIVVSARSQATSVDCPCCFSPSQRVQSRYVRTLADLPASGQSVRLVLQVRRFFCVNSACRRKIFVERLPGLADAHAQRTLRSQALLQAVGFALGGEAGSRLAEDVALPCRPDTLLRLVRRAVLAPAPTPRVLGVDDDAHRRGHTYGTILCDLERRVPVDLLPDRSAESFAAWLQVHPGVEIISRDRATTYAEGATRGAPDAIQVADRWHILKNLGEALELLFSHHRTTQLQREAAEPPTPDEETTHAWQTNRPKLTPHQEQARLAHRAERYPCYQLVVTLAERGLSQGEIARQVGLSIGTVNRWLVSGTYPERKRRRKQARVIDPYQAYLAIRWAEGCHNAMQLWREIRAQGYRGSYGVVYAQVVSSRQPRPSGDEARPPLSVSARKLVWLVLRRPDDLSCDEQEQLTALRHSSAEIDTAAALGQEFVLMLRERKGAQLDGWLERVATSGLPDLQRFAAGVIRDKATVQAGLTLPWSNGPTEGQVFRLKLVKRQMDGRGTFDLLRQRVLTPAA